MNDARRVALELAQAAFPQGCFTADQVVAVAKTYLAFLEEHPDARHRAVLDEQRPLRY